MIRRIRHCPLVDAVKSGRYGDFCGSDSARFPSVIHGWIWVMNFSLPASTITLPCRTTEKESDWIPALYRICCRGSFAVPEAYEP